MADLKLYFKTLLAKEAGFVNNKNDRGGATNKGITIANWMAYGRDVNGDGVINVTDLKAITDADAYEFYQKQFWDKMKLDGFRSQAIAEIVFDHAANAGISRAIKMLQFVLYYQFNQKDTIVMDGVVGMHTLASVNLISATKEKELYQAYIAMREAYYAYISAKSKTPQLDNFFKSLKVAPSKVQGATFYAGWINRLDYFKKKVLA